MNSTRPAATALAAGSGKAAKGSILQFSLSRAEISHALRQQSLTSLLHTRARQSLLQQPCSCALSHQTLDEHRHGGLRFSTYSPLQRTGQDSRSWSPRSSDPSADISRFGKDFRSKRVQGGNGWSSSSKSPKRSQGRESSGIFQRANQSQPQGKFNFKPPQKDGIRQTCQKLPGWIADFAKRRDIEDCAKAYGLSEEAARLILRETNASELSDEAHEGGERSRAVDVSGSVRKLLSRWSDDQCASLERLLEKWKSGGPSPVRIGGQSLEFYNTWDVEGLRSAVLVEGEQAAERYLLAHFLDDVQQKLTQVSEKDHITDTHKQVAKDTLFQLDSVRSVLDLRLPAHRYSTARSIIRNIHLHVGPTNSGKTHGALLALCKAKKGVYAGPLRLLAHEVWDRINHGTVSPGIPPRACNLVTGEEVRTVDLLAGLTSCTVEMCDLDLSTDVAVIDEIQMIGDSARGYAWTNAVLGIAAKELHLCGEASVVPLIEKLAKSCGDNVHIHNYTRLTPLEISDDSPDGDLSQIRKGDCVVTFARSKIFALKRLIEQKTGLRCAVAYGGLPPETRSEQAKLFNDPESGYDVMVASDAIGMGLNLKIKRVIFESVSKWNGKEQVYLSASQIKQIAGRAGRFGTSSDDSGGQVTTLYSNDLRALHAAMEAPVTPVTHGGLRPTSEDMSTLSRIVTAPDPRPAVKKRRSKAQKEDEGQDLEDEVDDDAEAGKAKEGQEGRTGAPAGNRSLAALYQDVTLLSCLDPELFFLSDFGQQFAISPILEKAARITSSTSPSQTNDGAPGSAGTTLTIIERETFVNGPVNIRDERVVQMLENMVRLYVLGQLVRFEKAAEHLGLLETLEGVEQIHRKAEAVRQQKLAEAGGRSGAVYVHPSAAHYAPLDAPLINVDALMILESLHRSISLYLWLSFRFPLAFCYKADAEAIKERTERTIEFLLEAIRIGRANRLAKISASKKRQQAREQEEEEEEQSDEEEEEEGEEENLSDVSAVGARFGEMSSPRSGRTHAHK